MRINLTDERKRLVLAVGSAVVIHIVILVLAGINSGKFDYTPEFGPLTVEISFDRPEVKPPEPEPPEVKTFTEAAAPEVETVQPEIQPTPPAPAAVEVKRPEPAPAAAAATTPPKTEPSKVDDSIIASIKSRTSGNNAGVDARSAFGDTRAPATTDSSTSVAASSATSGSEVLLSEAVAEDKPAAVTEQTPQRTSLLNESQLRNLDRSLSEGTTGGGPEVSSENSTTTSPVTGPVSGSSPNVVFRDPKVNRRLLSWTEPVIPDEARTEGRSQYVVKLEFEISPSGITSNVRILEGSGNTRLDAAVQAALRNWSFASDLSAQKNVRAVLTYVIEIK